VVHEIRDARDAFRRDVEAVDQARLALRRREQRLRLLVVDVERQPDGDASRLRLGDRARDDRRRRRLLQVEVVEGEVEAAPSLREPGGKLFSDLERRLAPVRQRADLDRQAYPRTRR
jgi:hypothetical protein